MVNRLLPFLLSSSGLYCYLFHFLGILHSRSRFLLPQPKSFPRNDHHEGFKRLSVRFFCHHLITFINPRQELPHISFSHCTGHPPNFDLRRFQHPWSPSGPAPVPCNISFLSILNTECPYTLSSRSQWGHLLLSRWPAIQSLYIYLSFLKFGMQRSRTLL